jgi:hypothetical protein
MTIYSIKQIRYYRVEADNSDEAMELFENTFDNFDEGKYEFAISQYDIEEITGDT